MLVCIYVSKAKVINLLMKVTIITIIGIMLLSNDKNTKDYLDRNKTTIINIVLRKEIKEIWLNLSARTYCQIWLTIWFIKCFKKTVSSNYRFFSLSNKSYFDISKGCNGSRTSNISSDR